MDFNKAIISGRLTRDPEAKVLPSGSAVTNFSVASNRKWTKDGEIQEEVEYHNIVVYGKQAETCARYLRKGNTALVEGRLSTRSWETDGVKHYRTEIVAERVIFGPKASDDVEPTDEAVPVTKTTQVPAASPTYYPEDEINPEDIPF
jgi:single-strand DNA-binding protein